MASFLKKVVLITGASSGIGAGTAIEFAKKGASLALVARREHKLQEVADQCMAEGLSKDKILLVPGDLTREADISSVFHDTVNHYGTIDTLVNNAGFANIRPVEELQLKDIDQMYQINARAVFQLSKLVIPYLKTSQGSIVNVSSAATQRIYAQCTAYAMAKAAMEQMTFYFASELAKDKVRVNSVLPGYIKTNVLMASGVFPTIEENDRVFEELKNIIPIGRYGTASDVAKAIVYLASDDAGFITGTKLFVDGGDMVRELGF